MSSLRQSTSDLKKVRFGLEDELYHYQPEGDSESPTESEVEEEIDQDLIGNLPPPLVSSSPSSLRSSSSDSGPFTPPSVRPPLPHDAKVIPVQVDIPDGIRLHPALTNPSVAWDTFRPPTQAVIPHLASCGEDSAILFYPRRLTDLTLVHPLLPSWSLRINLSSGLTVEDLYRKIYKHLYEELDGAQYSNDELVVLSHYQRCKEHQLSRMGEPLRRIDCMRLHRMFCGIREVNNDAGNWELNFLPITR